MPFPPQARFSIGRTYFLRSNISCTSIVLYLTSAVFHNGTLFLCELKARCKIALGRFCEPKKSRVKCAPAPFHIAPALHNFATEKFIKTPPTYCAKESHRIDRISFFSASAIIRALKMYTFCALHYLPGKEKFLKPRRRERQGYLYKLVSIPSFFILYKTTRWVVPKCLAAALAFPFFSLSASTISSFSNDDTNDS